MNFLTRACLTFFVKYKTENQFKICLVQLLADKYA